MRVPHRRLAEAEERLAAVKPRREHGRTSHGRVLARRSLHDPRSEQPRDCCRSRLPPASGYRMVAASDGRGSATRIRADLVAARGPRRSRTLIDLPLMSDPASLATLDVLTKIAPPAFYTDANLLALVICRAVNLSLERGNCDGSCFAYVWLGYDRRPALRRLPGGISLRPARL